jgi:hypothetical protein
MMVMVACRSRQSLGHLAQKHPTNNALARSGTDFRSSRGKPRDILDNGHDVGSEYALYMVGGLEKIAVLALPPAPPAALTPQAPLPIRPGRS